MNYSKQITHSPDTKGALQAIADLGYEMRNPYNDGFTCSIMKNRLIKIRTEVEHALKDTPIFTDE